MSEIKPDPAGRARRPPEPRLKRKLAARLKGANSFTLWDVALLLLIPAPLLLVASGLALVGLMECRWALAAKPEPAELTLEELVAKGPPPDNAYVRVTHFVPGKFYMETTGKDKKSGGEYVLFFGEHPDASGKVPVIVVFTYEKQGKEEVEKLSRQPSVTGVVDGRLQWREAIDRLQQKYPGTDFGSVPLLSTRSSVPSRADVLVMFSIAAGLVCLAGVSALGCFGLRWYRSRARRPALPDTVDEQQLRARWDRGS